MSLIAARYAESLIAIAIENNSVSEYKEQIIELNEIFSNSEIDDFFKASRISKEEKKNLIKNIFNDKLDKYILNFLYLLIDKNRIIHYKDIFNEFIKLANDNLNIVEGTIEVAHKVDDSLIKQLENSLSDNDYDVELKQIINEELISGFKINIDNRVIDNSLRNRSDNLKQSLLRKDGAQWK